MGYIKKEIRKKRTLKIHFNEIGELFCNRCKNFKDCNEFDICNTCITRNKRYSICKKCCYNSDKNSQKVIEQSLDIIVYHILKNVRNRYYKKKEKDERFISHELDKEFLIELFNKQKGLCALSGIKMTNYLGKGRIKTNMSLDRIDNSKGYTKDNVQFVCDHINVMKNNLTTEDLLMFCKAIVNYNEK